MGSARGSKSQYSHDESCDSAFGMDAKIANRSNSSGHPSPPAVARLDFLWEVDVVAAGYHIHLPHSDYESSRIFEKPFKHLFAGVARGYTPCLGYGAVPHTPGKGYGAVPHFSLFLRRQRQRKREKKYFGSNSLDRDVPRSPTEGGCPLHSHF